MATLYLYEGGSVAYDKFLADHPEWDGTDADKQLLLNGDLYINLGSALLGYRFDRIVIRFDSLFYWLQTANPRSLEDMGQALVKLVPNGRIIVEDRCDGEWLVKALRIVTAPKTIERRIDDLEAKIAALQHASMGGR
jgi:hypothetical protein